MDYIFPVGILSAHQEIGSVKYSNELYPYIVEKNTNEINHEVPRIFYRVLFEHRLGEGEKFAFEYIDYSSLTVDEVKSKLKTCVFAPNGVTFVHLPSYKTLKPSIKPALSSAKYEPNELINKFIASKPDAFTNGNDNEFMFAFSCPEKKSAVIIGTPASGTYPWNVAAALSSKLMPWYFEDKPLTEDEKNLIFSIDKNAEAFIDAAQVIYDKSEAKAVVESLRLKEMFNSAKQGLIDRFNSTIDVYTRKMEDCEATFSECARQIRDASMQKDALVNSNEDCPAAICDLLLKNPHIKIIRWSDNNPIFEVGGYNLQVSYPDALEANLDKPTYGVYKSSPIGLPFQAKKRLVEAVFLDHEISIPVCSTFIFSMTNNYIRTTGMESPHEPVVFKNSVYNPHHHYYNCLGNNSPKIAEYLAKGDYVNAIIQTQGCVPFWNVGDEAVTGRFTINEFWNKGRKIFRLPDGTMANYEDAIKWLLTEDKKEEE